MIDSDGFKIYKYPSKSQRKINPVYVELLEKQLESAEKLLKEMGLYLDHGHGTNINCNSGFHREITQLIKEISR